MSEEQLQEIRQKALEAGSLHWDALWLIVALLAEGALQLRNIESALSSIALNLPFAGKGN